MTSSTHSGPGDRRLESRLPGLRRLVRLLERKYDLYVEWYLPEYLTLVLAAFIYFWNPLRYGLPTGYAGLFCVMIEQIIAGNFALPDSVPYYGPGGMPFAYPPLALYIASFFVGVLRVPLFDYLRFAPPLVGVLALVAAYLLARTILARRAKALIVMILYATQRENHIYNIESGGIVRGISMIPLLLGIALVWKITRQAGSQRANVILATLCFALTLLTHLSAAAIFAITVAVLVITAPRRDGWVVRACVAILGGGALLTAPWWGSTLLHLGPGVFLSALDSHGNLPALGLDGANAIGPFIVMLRLLVNPGISWATTLIFGMTLLGLAYHLLRKNWTLPLWFFSLLYLVGESDRFVPLIGALMVADLLVDMSRFGPIADARPPQRLERWHTVVLLLLLLIFSGQGLVMLYSRQPSLSVDALELGHWFQTNTPPKATFAFASNQHDLAEWLIYLTRRTPLIAAWGAEWTGQFPQQARLFGRMAQCSVGQSYSCLVDLFRSMGQEPDYIIVPSYYARLTSEMAGVPSWRRVRGDAAFTVFARQQ